MKENKCDHCGNQVYDYRLGCLGCGAPVCCPRCCNEANNPESTPERSVEEKTLTDPNTPVEFTCPKCKADTDITFIIENERKIVAQAERQKREEVVEAERARLWAEIQKLPTVELVTDDKEMGEFLNAVDLDDLKALTQPNNK